MSTEKEKTILNPETRSDFSRACKLIAEKPEKTVVFGNTSYETYEVTRLRESGKQIIVDPEFIDTEKIKFYQAKIGTRSPVMTEYTRKIESKNSGNKSPRFSSKRKAPKNSIIFINRPF